MYKLLFLIVSLFLATSGLNANTPAGVKDFAGEWKFEFPDAPYGYQKGIIFIEYKNDKLAGEFRFSGGEVIKMLKPLIAEGILQFQVFADNNYTTVNATIEGNKLKGTALTADGNIPFEAIKVNKTE